MDYLKVAICIVFLAICTYYDVKEKVVYSKICVVFGILALLVEILIIHTNFQYILLGLIPGGLIYGLSVISNESIGKGDSGIIFVIGIILGIKNTFTVLFFALILTIIISMPLIIMKYKKLKSSMPFTPFIFVSFLGVMMF